MNYTTDLQFYSSMVMLGGAVILGLLLISIVVTFVYCVVKKTDSETRDLVLYRLVVTMCITAAITLIAKFLNS